MTTPALLVKAHHSHVTEREPDGTFEDCTWCSAIEWYRTCVDPSIPATHAEAEALRAASGEPTTGGSNIGDLRRGLKARYGYDAPLPISTFSVLWAALSPGRAAVAQGSMSAFGPNNPLSKYDRNFDGGHAVFVARVDDTDRVWWCDPEAPKGIDYEGVFITKDQLQKFVSAFGGQHLVRDLTSKPKPVTGDTMPALTSYLPGYLGAVKAGSNIRAAADIQSALLRTVASTGEKQTLIGTVKGDVDPANGSDVWYMWWANNRYEFTAKDNVPVVTAPATTVPVPVDDGFTKATQDAAVAAQKAADAVAAVGAVATAVAAERARIKGVLGL